MGRWKVLALNISRDRRPCTTQRAEAAGAPGGKVQEKGWPVQLSQHCVSSWKHQRPLIWVQLWAEGWWHMGTCGCWNMHGRQAQGQGRAHTGRGEERRVVRRTGAPSQLGLPPHNTTGCGLRQQSYFLMVLEAGSPRAGPRHGRVLARALFLMADVSVYPPMVEGEQAGSLASSPGALISSWGLHLTTTSPPKGSSS